MISGRRMFFDSAERRLNTKPVDKICSIPAAIPVERTQMSDSEEKWKDGNGKPFVIRVRIATPKKSPPIISPNMLSDNQFFFENPNPFKKDFFSDLVINQNMGIRKTAGFAINSSNQIGRLALNVAR